MNDLQGKRILFLGVTFFNYITEIKAELERLGGQVDFYEERPSGSFFGRVFLRLRMMWLVNKKIENHYAQIINKIKQQKYDYVFFMSAEAVNAENMTKIKRLQKDARFILYMCDSIQNRKNAKSVLKFFDEVYSFDESDCKSFAKIKFLPLYYLNCYRDMESVVTPAKYDICFIGTAHSDRYRFVKKIKKMTDKFGLKSFFYFFFKFKLLFISKKIIDYRCYSMKYKDISFEALSMGEVISAIKDSLCILDIEHPGQRGLTIRTIESMGAKRKLITTNKNVAQYDFYNPGNIAIVDRNNPLIDGDFFTHPYIDVPSDIYIKYSINSWLKNIFSLND